LAETSIQVADIKKKHPDLLQVMVDPFLPTSLVGATRDGAMSLWTHKHGTDAMYLALFRKEIG
jgi:16S rRNA (cytosine967-C5)-methyltransferase